MKSILSLSITLLTAMLPATYSYCAHAEVTPIELKVQVMNLNLKLTTISRMCNSLATEIASMNQAKLNVGVYPSEATIKDDAARQSACHLKFSTALIEGTQNLKLNTGKCKAAKSAIDEVYDYANSNFLKANHADLNSDPEELHYDGDLFVDQLNQKFNFLESTFALCK